MRRPSLVALFVALSLAASVSTAPRAHADPLTARDEATARFQTGLKYYDARDFESARLAFTQAYAVLQKPAILLNLAFSELYAGRPLEAHAHFEQYLSDPSPAADQHDRAKKGLDEAFKKTGHLALETASDAEVRIDDKVVTWPVMLVHVTAGSHAVAARRGDKSKTATVDARAGEKTSVVLPLDGAAGAGGSMPGHVEPPIEAGSSGHFWGWRSITGLALVGAGAVGLVLGVVASSDESSESDRVKTLGAGLPAPDACTKNPSATCAELAEAVDARDDAASRSRTFLVMGGITAAIGGALVVSAIVWPPGKSGAAGRIVPMTGPQTGGLLFTSRF